MDDFAKLFLQFDYPETKSLCKDFLTLVSATLVFSIAFSEKIIDFGHASRHTRQWLLSSWQCFIAAIIACGLGLCFLTLAAGRLVQRVLDRVGRSCRTIDGFNQFLQRAISIEWPLGKTLHAYRFEHLADCGVDLPHRRRY